MFSRSADAQVNVLPREMQNIGVIEHLNGQVPGDTTFLDENGQPVRLEQYFDGRRPVVLNLAYSRCATLCNMVLNAAVRALQETTWSVGVEFDAVTISIDPRETTARGQRAPGAGARPVQPPLRGARLALPHRLGVADPAGRRRGGLPVSL
ncbi:MAG: SCO family protein [Deltaproteobacteria bacterium]|nr:SCO family protein [Deltaproteobacteria bacterium]